MSTIVREEKYIKSDVNNNNNKWWTIQLLDSGDCITSWGRVGDAGQSKTFPGAGVGFLEKKCREKESERNGEIPYRKLNVIASSGIVQTSTTKTVTDAAIKEVAKKQIKTNNPIVTKLIEYLAKVNAHQITAATNNRITYNDTTGLFSTPLGIVTQDNIDAANKILVDVGDLVANKSYTDSLAQLTNDYNMLIPCDFGHKRLDVREFWSGLDKVQSQKQILDNLQASLVSATSNPATKKTINVPEDRVFDCQLYLVEDGKEIDRIRNLYRKTRQSIHQCYHLDVKTVYSLSINVVKEAWESDGAKIQNIWELWHGSRVSNVLSILRGGLMMPARSSSNVTGRMFSGHPGKEGLYFSDQSTKSLNYSAGYWSGGGSRDNNCFMFLCSVAMGKYFVPSGPRNDLPRPGHDSTFAKAHQSGVYNNECIVYRTSQCNLNHLIEFSPNGK